MIPIFYKTTDHFFPRLNTWLEGVEDPRNPKSITYPIQYLLWTGILMFLVRLGSRRQINFDFKTKEFIQNMTVLTQTSLETMAHDSTLAYLLERVQPEQISKVRDKMIQRLIRMKALSDYRIRGYYGVAIDGTGYLTFRDRHCDHCLTRTHQGKTRYHHNLLEAKMVLDNGMALSLETEFIENTHAHESKQDCELKAFKRLTEKLKQQFPQLNLCLLLDGLYANAKVFELCQKNGWKYIITFKEGSMPATYQEYRQLKLLHPDCASEVENDGVRQQYHWVQQMDYQGYLLNVLECRETKNNKTTTFVWVTNFTLDHSHVVETAKGGRLRWKIENEAFNIQKNGGYNLEHPYSHHEVALKNFYLLLQIAHLISQLIEKGNLLAKEIAKTFGSLRNLSRRLLESLRTCFFDRAQIQAIVSCPYQIRLRGP